MEISQYLSVFMDECAEHLQSLNHSLLELEKTPGDMDLLNTIFRAAHTLKGASMTMGFNKMAALTSSMEDVLGGMRNQDVPAAAEIISLLFEAVDLLEALAQGIAAGHEEEMEVSGVIQQLRRFAAGEESGSPAQPDKRKELQLRYTDAEKSSIVKAVDEGRTLLHVQIVLAKDCLLKGARAFMILRELERFGEVIRSIPEINDLEDEAFEDTFIVGLLSTSQPEEIAAAAAHITDVAAVNANRVPMRSVQIERRARETAEGLAADGASGRTPLQTVRVDMRKLDDLMNVVAELVHGRSRLEQLCMGLQVKDLSDALDQVGRLTTDLQHRVLQIRMVPVDNVFQRFPRLVRDLCKDTGKQANLVMQGGETELDRTVIDEIGDPLMHILRNCLDHGIEPSQEREAKGKPAKGNITLSAFQEGNNVIIKIMDDGRGLDLAKVGAKAVALGLVGQKELDDLTRDEIAQFVFAPGLTTSAAVTEVSGRGVGMDAVRAKIESLRGSVSVETEAEKQTTVTIRLPLTLAIIQALMVQLGRDYYLIPSNYIDSTISVSSREIKTVRNQEVALVREEVLPLIRLQNILGVGEAKNDDLDELDVVIVRRGNRRVGCIVDSLLKQQDVVLKPLGGFLGGIKGLAGATILGDGKVAFILDMRSVA